MAARGGVQAGDAASYSAALPRLVQETELQKMLADEKMRSEQHKTNYQMLKAEHTRSVVMSSDMNWDQGHSQDFTLGSGAQKLSAEGARIEVLRVLGIVEGVSPSPTD